MITESFLFNWFFHQNYKHIHLSTRTIVARYVYIPLWWNQIAFVFPVRARRETPRRASQYTVHYSTPSPVWPSLYTRRSHTYSLRPERYQRAHLISVTLRNGSLHLNIIPSFTVDYFINPQLYCDTSLTIHNKILLPSF